MQGTGGFLNPEKIIEDIGIIEEGMIIADFGCGHGYFTLPMARKVENSGKIYAIDVLPEALEAVGAKSRTEGLGNIEIQRRNVEKQGGSKIEDSSCDLVLMANLLFQTEEDEIAVGEAKRILKPDGKLVFIDWKPDAPLGPDGKRVAREEIKNLIEKEGFFLENDFPTDNYHYGMVFLRS